MEHMGILSLIPAAVVIILALLTKRVLEPLLLGAVAGFLVIAGVPGFFEAFIDAIYAVMMDGVTVWAILVLGLFGSLVALIEKSGGAFGFSSAMNKLAKTKKSALMSTYGFSFFIFADDYLNALVLGTTMRKITDKCRVSREFLAFVVNSVGATTCVLIPFSTWSAFMAVQLEASGAAAEGAGFSTYLQIIPFMLYAWIAILVVPLFIFQVIPAFGPMKKAQARAEAGQPLPDSMVGKVPSDDAIAFKKKPNALNFAIPMVLLVAVTIATHEMLYGVIVSILACILLFVPQKVMSLTEAFDSVISGYKDMLFALMIVISAFILQYVNDQLGLTAFVIESVEPILSPALLPVITFVVIGLLAFTTGSFWGVAAIAFPIIVPLAQVMDVNLLLACGAVISGAVFGSHTCFYSDAATLTCASTQIPNIDYARNVLPLIVVPFGISVIVFLITGIVMV